MRRSVAMILLCLVALSSAVSAARDVPDVDRAAVADGKRLGRMLAEKLAKDSSSVAAAGNANQVKLPAHFVPVYELLLSNDVPLVNATVGCDEHLAYSLPAVVAESLSYYKLLGYCRLPTADEQYARLRYALQYALSIQLRAEAAVHGFADTEAPPPAVCTTELRDAVAESVEILRAAAGDDDGGDQGGEEVEGRGGVTGHSGGMLCNASGDEAAETLVTPPLLDAQPVLLVGVAGRR